MRLIPVVVPVLCAMSLATTGLARAQAPRLGTITFPTSGSAEAQPHFIRGVLYLHSFEYDSAASAFRQAQRLDPDFAMAFWGEAMTYTHPVWFQQDAAAARAVLARLAPTADARLAKAPTPRERRWLETVGILYGEGSKERRDTLFAEAMGRLATDFPDDEARAFHALAILGTAHGGRDFATYMKAGAMVEDVFRRNPDHPGAAHYLIHSYDDPIHAPLGMRAARAYSTIAPGAAHAQHMTSHIFVAMGLWDDVVSANIAAWETSNRRNGHYTFWLEYGYLQQGRYGDARRFVDAIRADAARTKSPYAVGYAGLMVAAYVIDTEDWTGDVARYAADTLLALASTQQGFQPDVITAAFTVGMAAVARKDTTLATRMATEIESRIRAARSGAGGNQMVGSVGASEVVARTLRAAMARSAGRLDQAIDQLRAAVALEASLPFEFGPPESMKPPRELLGEVLLEAKRPAEAKIAFEQALARTPRRSRVLLGLARALVASGDRERAGRVYAELQQIWKNAEPAVEEAAEARRFAARD
jgi:tetratricopeptide (TPR) repeat protein